MALGAIINSSLSGILTSQEALRVTGNNITNVNTPGFARQAVRTEANVVGSLTSGVSIASIERVVDRFLDEAALRAASEATRFDAKSSLHDLLQSSLGTPDSDGSIGARINATFAALANLALDPSDAVARQSFLERLQGFAGEVSRIADEIQTLRADASRRIDNETGRANEALKQIFDTNRKIVEQTLRGGDVAALENQRQTAMNTLSEIIDIRLTRNADGSIDVSTGTGTQLVTRSFFGRLSHEQPAIVEPRSEFAPILLERIEPSSGLARGNPRTIDAEIRSGSLRGLLDMRDGDLVDMSVALGELAARVADEMNAEHNRSSAVPPPAALVGRATPFLATDPHNFAGTATFVVVDASGDVAASFTYDFGANPMATFSDVVTAVNTGLGGAGTLSLTGGVMRLEAAPPNSGVLIAEDDATASDRAGRSFSHFFGMNDLLEARSTGIFETGVAADDAHNIGAGGMLEFAVHDAFGREIARAVIDTGTTTTHQDILDAINDTTTGIGNFFTFALDAKGALVATPTSPTSNLGFALVNDSTDIGGTGVSYGAAFGIGEGRRAEAAIDFRLVDDTPGKAATLATARFDVGTMVGQPALAAGDQRGVLALQGLESKVISTRIAGQLAGQNRTLSTLGGAVMANFGLLADRAATSAEDSGALRVDVDFQRQSVSGVNLDEELSNLIIYQNSYNAAARMLATVQELFDTLLASV